MIEHPESGLLFDYPKSPSEREFHIAIEKHGWLVGHRDFLPTLTERDQAILDRRFGLSDSVLHTVNSIADDLGMPPDTVQDIIMRGMADLRAAANDIKCTSTTEVDFL